MSQKEFEKIVNDDKFAGSVIRLCAVFESSLDSCLTSYFTSHNDRSMEFHGLVIERLSLHQKIEILEKIDFRRSTKSRDNFLASLKTLKKLRNKLAHTYNVCGEVELRKLYSDSTIRSWVLNYPKSISDEKRNMEVRTTKLFKAAMQES